MLAIDVQGRAIALGPKGFMLNFDAWDEDVARALAAEDGLELQECHWKAIHFVRRYFQQHEMPPTPKVLIRDVGGQLHAYRCGYKTLKQLFPQGGCKQVCRLAGLPDYYCQL